MNQNKAKKIRRIIYGDLSIRARRYGTKTTKEWKEKVGDFFKVFRRHQLLADKTRAKYQLAKKFYTSTSRTNRSNLPALLAMLDEAKGGSR